MEYPLNAIDYYYRTEGDDQPGQRKQFSKLCDTDRKEPSIQVYQCRSLLAVKVQIKRFSFPICKMGKEFLDLYYCAGWKTPSFLDCFQPAAQYFLPQITPAEAAFLIP